MAPAAGDGTVSEHEARPNGADEENALLLGKSKEGHAIDERLHKHMTVDINKSWGDIALLGCYIITGLLDSSAVFIWGSFVSMQTGNTVYLGLGLVAPNDGNRWIRSGISIVCFCLGSLFFSTYHRWLSPRKRWVLVTSYAIQTAMIIIAALMVTLGPATSTEGPVNIWVAIPLALIAFQSSGQAVTSRVLQYGGLTSVVLTSNYCDLFSDPKLFTPGIRENVERSRRTAAPILLLVGALFGGLWAHSSVGLAGALWTAAILKAAVVIAWLFWAAEPDHE